MIKLCAHCGEQKSLADYNWRTRRHGLRMPMCRECQRKKNRIYREKHREEARETTKQWNLANKERRHENAQRRNRSLGRHLRSWLAAFKQSVGCADCGYRDEAARLHFDHRPGTIKRMEVSKMVGYPLPDVIAEIRKCDVRCVCCHRKRHAREEAA